MNDFLNVRDLPSSVSPVSAAGDGCADDTTAIQNAVDALSRVNATSTGCAGAIDSSTKKWASYVAGLYFPAGLYRISSPIVMPRFQQVRMFGDGGRGGELSSADSVQKPTGTVILQETADAPIFEFRFGVTIGVGIQNLGFSYRERQEEPAAYDEDDPSQRTDPGACAILFSAPTGAPSDYQNIRIADCAFERGWRGVSIDDTHRGGQISFFGSTIERCTFRQHRGAAISLVNNSGHIIGMTGNALRDLFIENYDRFNLDGEVTQRSDNIEPQIRLLAQAGCTLDGIDAEGSKRLVISAADCVMQITNLYLEHVEVEGVDPRLLYFGGGRYSLHGLNLDGLMHAQKRLNGSQSVSTIINADNNAEVAISGVRSNPFPPAAKDPQDPDAPDTDVDGGFLPFEGDAYLVRGLDATFTLLDRPFLPNLPESERGQVIYDSPQGPILGAYKELLMYTEGRDEVARVRAPLAKVVPLLSFGVLQPGQTVTRTVGSCENSNFTTDLLSQPGDLVTLGPPEDLPAGLIAMGLVTEPGCVEVRLYNTTASAVSTAANRSWVIETGGGRQGGAAQVIGTGSPAQPYPPNS